MATAEISSFAELASLMFHDHTLESWKFRFFNRAAGRVLDADALAIHSDGCKVQLWDEIYDNANQWWRLIPTTYQGVFGIQCLAGGKFLDAEEDLVAKDGCKVRLCGSDANAANRQWSIFDSASGLGLSIGCFAGGQILDAVFHEIERNGCPLQLGSATGFLPSQAWLIRCEQHGHA